MTSPLEKYEQARVNCPRCGRSVAASILDAGLHHCSPEEGK